MATAALPLAEHCQFRSASFEAMHRRLNNVLKPHRLRRLSRTPVSGIICRATLHRISISLMRISPAVDVRPGTLEHFYLVQVPIQGAVEISHGEDRLCCAGSVAAVISPEERLRAQWSDNCTQLIVQIPRETIENRLVARFGRNPRPPLKFRTAFDLETPAAREWRHLLDFAVRTIDEGGVFSRDPLHIELEDLLVSSLLLTQPHNYADTWRSGGSTAPYYVLRAERRMRERLALPHTIASLAEAAGVSERTLHDGFRRFRSTTPMRRLSVLRLAAARRRLQCAEPGLTVARAATDVGFFQLGRFAQAYRSTFGELPSVTLRIALRRRA
ncbi:MAG: helix-turn-helix domain-containing protein [Hyphomicrobiales bacterium]|nr:helix-turn-helix domain-containing protein [Hyphomicrobiales bacterium]MDE1972121.1 helix-turn-helix domain-containing protein [Hyphomicrobiales bacterium]MDE2285698.1 helix-turn-helix domain-containing protein [Hyphomicrobiales bacterium]